MSAIEQPLNKKQVDLSTNSNQHFQTNIEGNLWLDYLVGRHRHSFQIRWVAFFNALPWNTRRLKITDEWKCRPLCISAIVLITPPAVPRQCHQHKSSSATIVFRLQKFGQDFQSKNLNLCSSFLKSYIVTKKFRTLCQVWEVQTKFPKLFELQASDPYLKIWLTWHWKQSWINSEVHLVKRK